MLSIATERPVEPAEFLDRVLCLTTWLRLVARGKANHGPYLLKEGFPDPGDELGAMVKQNILREAVVAEHMLKQSFHNLESRGKSVKREKPTVFRKIVNHHMDGCVAL